MTLIETSTGQPRQFSDVVELLGHRAGSRLCLGEIVETFGDRAFGPLMLFFAVLNMLPWPPGGTTVTGAPLLLLSMELAWGRDELWVPRWAERLSVSRPTYWRLSSRLLPLIRFSEHLSRPRLTWMVGSFGQGMIGLASVLLSIILVLPVWGGNLLPAVAMGFFALGVTQRDGLAAILGWIVTGVTAVVIVLAWKLVVAGAEAGWDWISGLG